MTVTVTKPQATLRELLATLKKKTGLFGEQIARTDTITDFYNIVGDNRNLIINGNFLISQRGTYTSATALTGAITYYLDRFKMFESAASSSTFQHKLDQQLGDGSYANTLNITATAANSIPVVQYYVEEYKSVWGKAFTLSFWYKSNKPWTWNIYNGTTQWHYQIPSSDGVWKKYSQTITLPQNGNQLRFELYRYGAEGSLISGDYFEFTKMQLELGSVATPFEYRTYQQELALCQRYYYEDYIYMQSYQLSGQDYSILIRHPVTMRTSPTFTTGSALINVNTTNFLIAVVPGASDTTKAFRPYIRANATGLVEYNIKYFANAEL